LRSLDGYRDRTAWRKIMHQVMALAFGWEGSASRYLDVYLRALAARSTAG